MNNVIYMHRRHLPGENYSLNPAGAIPGENYSLNAAGAIPGENYSLNPAGQTTDASVYLDVLNECRSSVSFWKSASVVALAVIVGQYAYHRYASGRPLLGR